MYAYAVIIINSIINAAFIHILGIRDVIIVTHTDIISISITTIVMMNIVICFNPCDTIMFRFNILRMNAARIYLREGECTINK